MNDFTIGAGLEGVAGEQRGLQARVEDDTRKVGGLMRGCVNLGLFFALPGWNAGLHWPVEVWMSFKDLLEQNVFH